MAEISYRRFTPNDIATIGYSGSPVSDGIALLIAPLAQYSELKYLVDSVTVALAHRNNQAAHHGTPTVISCYIADNITLGTTSFPPALVTAENTIPSTDVSAYQYGVYDGTFSLHTFTFHEQLPLSSQNWVILSQSTGDPTFQSFTVLAGWKLSHGTFVGEKDGSLSGITRYRASGVLGWQTGGFATQYQYLDAAGVFIGGPPEPPDDLITFPPSRPDDYNPDLYWPPGEWTDPDTYVPGDWRSDYVATGGGRWGQNLVVCGNKKIYYEPHEGI